MRNTPTVKKSSSKEFKKNILLACVLIQFALVAFGALYLTEGLYRVGVILLVLAFIILTGGIYYFVRDDMIRNKLEKT